MATAAWIKDMLEKRGVAYEELHHRVAFTAQEVAQSEHISGDRVAKVVVIIADDRPIELILPASRRVVLDRVRKLVGADAIRLASEAEMNQIFTDCETGAIPPLRHWKDVAVLMDASISNARELVFQAGTHEDAIRLNFQDWLELVKPRVEFFSKPERASARSAFADREDIRTQRSGRTSTARAEVIDALRDGQVAALILGPDPGASASHCIGCYALFATPHAICPFCHTPCRTGNLWQKVLAFAVGHGIWTHRAQSSATLASHGGIAALLRRDEPQWGPAPTPAGELKGIAQ